MVTWRARKIFVDTGLTLIAIESVDFHYDKTDGSCHLYGNIKPIAIIVRTQEDTDLLAIGKQSVDFDRLRKNIPGLDTLMHTAKPAGGAR